MTRLILFGLVLFLAACSSRAPVASITPDLPPRTIGSTIIRTSDAAATELAVTQKIFATLTASAPQATEQSQLATETPATHSTRPPDPTKDENQVTAVANATVNIRELPDRNSKALGQVKEGEVIVLTGTTDGEEWYRFEKGWVIASAVGVTGDTTLLETVEFLAPATAAPIATQQVNNPTSSAPVGVCSSGCSESTPPANCLIKGNVNSDGVKIFHSPGQQAYGITKIKPEEGDRWFCTAEEAVANGFRAAQR